MSGLEQPRPHRHFAAELFVFMHAIARAAGRIEGQPFAPQTGVLLTGEIDAAVVDHHHLGEQLLGRAQNPRHAHAHERVVAHEPGEFQVLRVLADQRQHLPECAKVADATAMQPDIQFDVHPYSRAQPLSQGEVLLQALRRIEQPLQLLRRVERPLVRLIEQLGRTHRQRLAQQNVGLGKLHRVMIEKRLVKRHQALGAGTSGDVGQQSRRRQ
ncbi:hypothetical protein D3C86_1204910 [compost metagenome]